MAKKKKNINDMSFDELIDSLNELKQEVFNINIQKLAGQFEDTSQTVSYTHLTLPTIE